MERQPERVQNLLGMCVLAVLVGIVGGLGAWVFRVLIGLAHNLFFLGQLNYEYNANVHTPTNPWGAGVILVPVIGALLVAWLVANFAPEAKGHGVPEVMDAIYYNRGRIRPIVAVVKSLASAICIGTGGSVGREGPIIQIGSAFGATLGSIVRVPARQQITLVAAGAAAGIAATFNAPLGGVVFAIELLLVSVNVRNLLPVSIATVTATYISRAMLGTHPAFNHPPLQVNDFELTSPWMLLLFIPFGVVIGLTSVAFIKGLYWAEDRFDAMPGNVYTRHATGMLIVGVIIYVMWRTTGKYYVEGIGYATIMDVLSGSLAVPAFLLLLAVLKWLTTCLTLGSGGSGGVFSPALFMGATLGACFAHVAQWLLPGVEINVVAFAVAGMAAGIGASTGAMITAAVMLQEMTDDNNVVLPIIVTTIVACAVRKVLSPGSIYTLKLIRRGHVVPEGLQAAMDDARNVAQVMRKDFQVVDDDAAATPTSGVVVTEQYGHVLRVLHPYGTVAESSSQPAEDGKAYIRLTPGTPLIDAMRDMLQAGAGCALVFSQPGSDLASDLVGVLTLRELSLYRAQQSELL